MWKIHGKVYDLNPFLEHHPGGRLILEQAEGVDDLTAAFESYHAMSDIEKIKKIMLKYEIKDKTYEKEFNFDENMFYFKLKDKVKNYFTNNKINHHTDIFWVIKVSVQMIIYLSSFILSCYFKNIPFFFRLILNIISGHMFIQCGFTIMHDASHHAVSYNKNVNELLTSVWNSLALWNTQVWYKHHTIMHHSFTGSKKDPDTIHFNPFVRKSIQERPGKYLKFNKYATLFYLNIFPGMWLGQVIAYHLGLLKNRLWRMSIKYKLKLHELMLSLFTTFSLLYSGSIYLIFSFIIICNITYSFCILPDHDTFETHSNLVYDTKNTDWGELQVRNSGNFLTNNSWINYFYGGINYQIEHHLFPTISHIHYPEISKIIKKTCDEHNIPYVEHQNIFNTISSVIRNFEEVSKDKSENYKLKST